MKHRTEKVCNIIISWHIFHVSWEMKLTDKFSSHCFVVFDFFRVFVQVHHSLPDTARLQVLCVDWWKLKAKQSLIWRPNIACYKHNFPNIIKWHILYLVSVMLYRICLEKMSVSVEPKGHMASEARFICSGNLPKDNPTIKTTCKLIKLKATENSNCFRMKTMS